MCGWWDDSATPARDACRPAAPYAIGVSSGLKLYPGPHDSMQGFRLKGGVVTAPMDQPNTPDRPVSRKEARRLLNQVAVGVGAQAGWVTVDIRTVSTRGTTLCSSTTC